ncbi:hypothetical protein ACQ859_18290 [Roseateles chitinivorans]|uniref:hypothetical protein n=1 Tax=Roseateles chitinivorans TaxID=2917965 RepID=UPI003D66EDEF
MTFSKTPLIGPICLKAVVGVTLSLSLNEGRAMSRLGDAEVRLQDGVPCFTLSAKDAKRDPNVRLSSISVSDASVRPVIDVWRLVFEPGKAVPLLGPGCFAYGQQSEGSRPATAGELANGIVYDVALNVSPSDSSDPTKGYVAKFCLAGQGGDRRLVPVRPDTRAWREGRCNQQ